MICIHGVIPPDPHWDKMRKAYEACREAGVPIPAEVTAYFGTPDPTFSFPPQEQTLALPKAVSTNMQGVHTIFLDQLPPGVTKIRVSDTYHS